MKGLIRTLCFVFLMIPFLLVSSMGWAQSSGSLRGTVSDSNEALPLPTVEVKVLGTKLFGTTNSNGEFEILGVPAGTYKIVFELPGFLTESVKEVTITAGQTTELEVTLKMGFAHEMTVTARRAVVRLQKVPQNIEVLTATELEETPAINVLQALNNMIGVDVESSSSITGTGTFMSINGYSDIYIKKMVDGVNVGEVVTNWSMLNSYPQEMIEQVEVIKGGSSSVWGSNMAGIINLVTKRPRDMERPIFTLKGIFSSFGEMNFENASVIPQSGNMKRFSANIIGSHKDFGYMFGLKRDDNKLFTDNGTEKNWNIFTKIGYNFTDTTYLDFLYNFNKINSTSHEFMERDDYLPAYQYAWNYNTANDAKAQAASLKFSSLVLPALNLEAQLKFNRTFGEFTRQWLAGGRSNRGAAGTETSSSFVDQKIGFTLKGSYNPNESFSLVSGVDYYRVKADFSDFILDQPIIFVDEFAPFINAEYRIGGLGIHAGARYDYDSSFGNQVSPSVGAVFNFLKSSLVRINVARTFRVPPLWFTLGETYANFILPNPNLKPERAWAYSIGFESQELEYVWIKVSFYLHEMTDGIVWIPSVSQPGRLIWDNASNFTRKGYEAELGFLTPFGLSGYLATNYNDHNQIAEDGSETILDEIPTRTYKSGLKYKNEKLDLMVNFRGRWVWWNISYLPYETRDKVWAFDLRVIKGFSISENVRIAIFLDVYNLSDRLYWERKDSPNPRRRAELGFELKFK